MTPARSRWTEPATIVAIAAVLYSAYWQYEAIGRDDAKQVSTTLNEHATAISANTSRIKALEDLIAVRASARDREMGDLRDEIRRRR